MAIRIHFIKSRNEVFVHKKSWHHEREYTENNNLNSAKNDIAIFCKNFSVLVNVYSVYALSNTMVLN